MRPDRTRRLDICWMISCIDMIIYADIHPFSHELLVARNCANCALAIHRPRALARGGSYKYSADYRPLPKQDWEIAEEKRRRESGLETSADKMEKQEQSGKDLDGCEKKLLDVKRFEKEQGILKNIQEKAKLTTKQIEELEEKLLSKYNSVYDAMLNIAIKGNDEINDLKLQKNVLTIIEDICSKMKLPSVELRGILEISNNQSNGVELIRKTLSDAENVEDAKIEITYLGAPRYRLSLVSQDFKTAEKSLKPILEKIEKSVKKQNGKYNFTREESIKTGEG